MRRNLYSRVPCGLKWKLGLCLEASLCSVASTSPSSAPPLPYLCPPRGQSLINHLHEILIPNSASGGPVLGEAVGVASWMGLSTGLD